MKNWVEQTGFKVSSVYVINSIWLYCIFTIFLYIPYHNDLPYSIYAITENKWLWGFEVIKYGLMQEYVLEMSLDGDFHKSKMGRKNYFKGMKSLALSKVIPEWHGPFLIPYTLCSPNNLDFSSSSSFYSYFFALCTFPCLCNSLPWVF